AGAAERLAARQGERDRLDMGRKIDAAALWAQSQEVRHRLGPELRDGPALKPSPGRAVELAEVPGGGPLPGAPGAAGVIEQPGPLVGDPPAERPASPADRERKTHDAPPSDPPPGPGAVTDPPAPGPSATAPSGAVRGPRPAPGPGRSEYQKTATR